MRKYTTTVAVAAVALACAGGAQADVVMETVTVGNPGNADDTQGTGYGGVDYCFNIGKYEVTAGQYTEFLNAVAASDPYGLYNTSMDSNGWGCQITRHGSSGSYWYDFSGGSDEAPGSTAADWADRPVNYVSWADAARFANWLYNGQPTGAQDPATTENGSYDLSPTQDYYGPGGELPTPGSDDWYALNMALAAVIREPGATWAIPTEDEWYKAAYHKNNGVTGDYWNYPTSSNGNPSNDLIDPDLGNNATYDGDTIGSPYNRTEVGAHENSNSPYGTFDQGGNVWEWAPGSLSRVRGGAFSSSIRTLHVMIRPLTNPTTEDYYIGFRVAEVPGPADCNCDGDLDLQDWALFEACLDGPGVPRAAGCACADVTGDGAVDLSDFAEFQMLFTG